MSNIWQSAVTDKMASHLSDEERQELIDTLDDVVQRVCEEWRID